MGIDELELKIKGIIGKRNEISSTVHKNIEQAETRDVASGLNEVVMVARMLTLFAEYHGVELDPNMLLKK